MRARWPAVLDALLDERGRALFGYAYLLTGSVEDAEDLVQSALVKAFSRGRAMPSVPQAEAYVRATIRTLFIDDRRLARHHRERLGVEADAAIPARTERVDDRIVLRRALLTLPPRERACVVLRFYDDLTTEAIARELGLARGTVRGYLSDGIRRLQGALGDLGVDVELAMSGGAERIAVVSTASPRKGTP